MICVFPSDASDFSGNGLGAVTPTTCIVTETLNGEWELQLTHPLDDEGKWARLVEGNILRAPVPAASTPLVRMTAPRAEIRQVYKTTAKIGLRCGRGTGYKIITYVKKNAEVLTVGAAVNSWFEVVCSNGKRGYLPASVLSYERTESLPDEALNSVIEPKQLRDQPFRIYRVVPSLTDVQVYTRHIFYDLLDNMITSYKPGANVTGATVAQGVMSGCQSEHAFSMFSDLTTTAAEVSFENTNPVEALLGEGGVVEKYKGELARDWFDVYVVNRVGVDSNVEIRQGKNLLGITYDVDETNVATRIMPTGETKDGELLYLDGLYVDSPHIGEYPHPKWIHLPVSEVKVGTDGLTTAQARVKLREAAQKELDAGCDLPDVTLSVDFLNVGDTVEYAHYRPLGDIFLGDSVKVVVPKLNVSVMLRMIQYEYDCLLRRYIKATLGTATETLEGSTISGKQIPSGSIGGTKLIHGSVGTGQLQNASVGSLQVKTAAIGAAHIQDAAIKTAHIEDACITRAKIATALITALNVEALTAVSARIQELVSGNITADELYASIAAIAAAQITTANIQSAAIEWADIESLSARIANIVTAEITTADIDWASISTLSAAVAAIVSANIENADIDFARVKDMTADTAIITQGAGGKLYIDRLAVSEANMVSLSVGELLVKGADGKLYSVGIDLEGNIVTSEKSVGEGDILDGTIPAGKLIEHSITARELNVSSIFADNALIRAIKAANIDVADLVASEAFIGTLRTHVVTSADVDSKIALSEIERAGYRLEISFSRGAIVTTTDAQTVCSAKVYKNDIDVTDTFDADCFSWTRISDDAVSDAAWNADNAHISTKSITLGMNDAVGSAVIRCEFSLGDGVYPTCITYLNGDLLADVAGGNEVYGNLRVSDEGMLISDIPDAFAMNADGELVYACPPLLTAQADILSGIKTSYIVIRDDSISIRSGGNMSIEAGGDFLLKAGDTAGEYLGISSAGDTVIFTGAENALGEQPKFSLSKYGELAARDADISGEIDVSGAMTFGEGVLVTFRDVAARYNFLRALAAGDALPYDMGGTNALSRENAMRNMSLIVGSSPVSDIIASHIGDRYLLLMPGSSTPANTVTLSAGGYRRIKTNSQRRLKTQKTYSYSPLSGDTEYLPANTTTYGGWYSTGAPVYGDIQTADVPYCYETTGTASGQYSGSVATTTATKSMPSDNDPSGTFYYIETKKTNYQYRDYSRYVYWAVLPAPTGGVSESDIKSAAVKSALLTLSLSNSAPADYTLSLATSDDGQTGKAVIGTARGAATVAFSLMDCVETLRTQTRYLVLERAGESASAISITGATLALSYYSGAKRTEEYVWNGASWQLTAKGAGEYEFDETTDSVVSAGDSVFNADVSGDDGAQYEFQLIAFSSGASNFLIYVNGDTVAANYRKQIVCGNSAPITNETRIASASGAANPSISRGTISVLNGYVFIEGRSLWGSDVASHYAIVYGDGEASLTSLQIKTSAGATAGCRLRVRRMM